MWLCACVFIEYDVISIFQSLFVSDSSTEWHIIFQSRSLSQARFLIIT